MKNNLKRFALFCSAVFFFFCLAGCGGKESNNTFESGGATYQIVTMENGTDITDYFSFTGSSSGISVGGGTGSVYVYYQQTVDLGWVLWAGRTYAYTETNVGSDSMQNAAFAFALQTDAIEPFGLDQW